MTKSQVRICIANFVFTAIALLTFVFYVILSYKVFSKTEFAFLVKIPLSIIAISGTIFVADWLLPYIIKRSQHNG